MTRIAFAAAILAALIPTAAQDAKKAAPTLALTLSADRAKVLVGDEIQLEVKLENTGDKDLEINEFTYEERSLSFDVNAQFKGEGDPKKAYTLALIRPDAQVMARLPLGRIVLAPRKSVNLIHRTLAIAVGKFEYKGKYSTGEASVTSNGVNVEVEATTSGSRLAATFEVADQGAFTMWLDPVTSPANVTQFATLIRRGFYNDTLVHRIVKSNWIHMGCPYGLGIGGPGYAVRAELDKDKKHVRGTVSLSGFEKNGYTGSQFFICLTTLASCDGKFTIVGKIENADMDKAIDGIAKKAGNSETPPQPIKVKTAKLEVR